MVTNVNLEEVANEDLIAASIWGGLGLVSGAKVIFLIATEQFSASMIGPIIGTICGAVIGYRHVQNLATIAGAKIKRDQRRDEMEHEREMAKILHAKEPAKEFDSEFPFDRKATAKPNEDTVDIP
jgi:hypothetical protein